MNKYLRLLLLYVFALASSASYAAELTVSETWIREAPPVSKVQAAYLLIGNPMDMPVELIKATSPVYSKIEFHRTVIEKGLARMLQKQSLNIPAKSELRLQPEGTHMMLFNPTQRLNAGDKVPLTLFFSNQKQLDVMFTVKKTSGSSHQHHNHH